MAFTKNRDVRRISVYIPDESIEIQWYIEVFEDGELMGTRTQDKRYTVENSTDLDTDVGAGMATKLKNIFNW